jgi:flagellar motor protein MotB
MKRLLLGITATSLTALLALAACQTAPRDGGLLPAARDAIAHAEADPNVTRYAATELDRARKLLVNAEGAARQKGASDKVAAHYAYLATQMARISEQRAHEQVAMAIIQRGVAAERVRALGYGEEFPKASNNSDGSRQLNRRVEIIVSNGGDTIPGRQATGNP